MLGLEPEILFDHPDFWIVNKPVGWTVQRDDHAPGILEWLSSQFAQPALPVHRLDKPTSGLLIVAKNSSGNRTLSTAFAARDIRKTYLAISDVKPKKKQGWIKGDMAQSRRSQWKLMRTQENPAITQFESIALDDGLRAFVLHPKTGKTHQLRVALKSLGSPILGDELYGGHDADRLYLHAWRLAFNYDGKAFAFEAEPTGLWFDRYFAQLKEG